MKFDYLFDVFKLLGGLAFFLYGMNLMGSALEKRAGSRLKEILAKLTKNTFSGFLLGLGITAVIQSSSATTVMVVGFVNSGIMTLKQSIGVIMGANLGTSVTAWLLSSSQITGESFILQLLKPSSFTPILAFIGIIIIMFVKRQKTRDTALILIGFAILMTGMDIMSAAVEPISSTEQFQRLFVMFSNPLLGVIVGTVLTAIIQSSSASVGILQALTLSGTIHYSAVVPIVMGQNIGTCVSAMISSIGASKNARRAAVVHLSFNIIATLILLPLFYIADFFFDFAFVDMAASPLGVAIVHTTFKIAALALLMPAAGLLEKLARLIVRDGKGGDELNLPDERLFATPPIAVASARESATTMGRLSNELVLRSLDLLDNYTEEGVAYVVDGENRVDKYEDSLGTYLVKLSAIDISKADASEVSMLLHLIGDFERISDHAKNICESAVELHDKKLNFSDNAKKELAAIRGAVSEALKLAIDAYENENVETAALVEPLEQVVDKLKDRIKRRHIERLKNGECTIEQGFVLTDLLTNLERIADHASNIAVCVIDLKNNNFDSHAYLDKVKHDSAEFDSLYEVYKKKYAI